LKSAEISKLMKIRPVGGELFHADERTDGRTDRQTDMTKLTVAFRSFVNAPKKFHKNRLCEAWYPIDGILKMFCVST
jgi:hypothetical protein